MLEKDSSCQPQQQCRTVRAAADLGGSGGGGGTVEWVQCEAPGCGKWRLLPPTVKAAVRDSARSSSSRGGGGGSTSTSTTSVLLPAASGLSKLQFHSNPLGISWEV